MRPEIADLTQFVMPQLARNYDFPSFGDQDNSLLETVPVKMGSSTKKADLVYFHQGVPIVLVEAKKEGKNRQDAIDQALSYIKNYPIENERFAGKGIRPKYFVITIGKDFEFFKHIYEIGKNGQVVDRYETIQPIMFGDLLIEYGLVAEVPARKMDKDLFYDFLGELLAIYNIKNERIHKDIILNISKQIYAYLKDPENYYSREPYVYLDDHRERQARIRQLFRQYDLKNSLNPENADIYRDFVLRAFQGLNFNQYMTNSSVIGLMINLVNIKSDSKVLDFECGSGGFLVAALKKGASIENIKGIDIDELPYMVTKTYMAIYSGKCGDGLEQIEKTIKKNNGLFYHGDNWDIVIGNPAGGSKYEQGDLDKIKNEGLENLKNRPHTFSEYELSIQQAVRSTKADGEICLILPEGFFSNSQDDFLRNYVAKNCKVLAIISLPRGVFKKGTEVKGLKYGTSTSHQKMSILFAKKIKNAVNYPIFLASMDHPENLEAKLNFLLKQWNSWKNKGGLTEANEEEIKEITKVEPKMKKEMVNKNQASLFSDIAKKEPKPKKEAKKSFTTKISEGLKDLFK